MVSAEYQLYIILIYILVQKKIWCNFIKRYCITDFATENSVIANKYMNSLIYTAYALNLNERYKMKYRSSDIEESVNIFLSTILNRF